MIIDLTRPMNKYIIVYPGDPFPVFHKLNDVVKDGFEMYEVTSGMHVGTHMDAPLHFFQNGQHIDEIQVDKFIGKGVVVENLATQLPKLERGQIVLVKTGHEKLWTTPEYYTEYPKLPIEFARLCVEKKVKMVCVDMPSVDYPPHEVHKLLLGNDILVVENVCNLDLLDGVKDFEVFALPARYATEAAPCRIIARS